MQSSRHSCKTHIVFFFESKIDWKTFGSIERGTHLAFNVSRSGKCNWYDFNSHSFRYIKWSLCDYRNCLCFQPDSCLYNLKCPSDGVIGYILWDSTPTRLHNGVCIIKICGIDIVYFNSAYNCMPYFPHILFCRRFDTRVGATSNIPYD